MEVKESDFQHYLIEEIYDRFPGCIVLKNDPRYKRGIPDLLILYKSTWAALEVKRSENARRRPLQEERIAIMNKMSYSSFIDPKNMEVVLNGMERSFERALKAKR